MAPGGAADHIRESCEELGFGALCAYSNTLAFLFLVFVVLVVSISFSLHLLEHWVEHHFDGIHMAGLGKGLKDALERVKEEFMITGMIALLLFAFGRNLEALTCTKKVEDKGGVYPGKEGYKPEGDDGRRRSLLAADSTCKEAKIPFIELEYAHILLLLAALVNVVYSLVTIFVTMKRIAGWKPFETRLKKSAELQPLSEKGIISITSGFYRSMASCLPRQFYVPFLWKGVCYDAYRAARHAAMEYWRPLIFEQMLLKAQDQAAVVLQTQVQVLFRPNVPGMQKMTVNEEVVDKLVASAQRFRDETFFMSEAALEKQRQQRERRFENQYRVRVRDFSFIPLLQLLAVEQFAEDRIMAFLMPTIIGVCLLLPHESYIFAWLPPIVFLIMLGIGYELQRVLLELKRRYHARYEIEFPRIKNRLRWRKAVCKVIEQQCGPNDKFASHKQSIPQIPHVVFHDHVKRKLEKRTNKDRYRLDEFDSSSFFHLPASLVLRMFVFCYYCNAFFLAVVGYTAWIKPKEFNNRKGLMAYLIMFSTASMLHGALNITPLYALITSSSSQTPKHFAQNLEEAQDKMRQDKNSMELALWLRESNFIRRTTSLSTNRKAVWNEGPLRERYIGETKQGNRADHPMDVEAQARLVTGPRQGPVVTEDDLRGADRLNLLSSSTLKSS